jgi:hypothetical protein
MFKRVIKIILILLAVFLLVLGIIWLIGRHKTEKSGAASLSFKQFLGLSTKLSPNGTLPVENNSSFTNNGFGQNGTGSNGGAGGNGVGSGAGNGSGGAGGNGVGSGAGNGSGGAGGNGVGSGAGNGVGNGVGDVNVSQFTNNGTTIGDTGTIGSGSGDDTSTSTTSSDDGSDDSTTAAAAATAPVCGDADNNITFTPEEQAELNELQNRFYTIAQTLHTDADVETELANHDAFAIKADQVTELYNYCEEQLPTINATARQAGDPRMTLHVATPFWHSWGKNVPSLISQMWSSESGDQALTVDPAQDSLSFIDFNSPTIDAAHMQDIHDNGLVTPDTSGIQGPYGVLNFSSPTGVEINGSILKTNTSTSLTGSGIAKLVIGGATPLGALAPGLFLNSGKLTTTTTTGPDFQLLIPVVEKILRINLW